MLNGWVSHLRTGKLDVYVDWSEEPKPTGKFIYTSRWELIPSLWIEVEELTRHLLRNQPSIGNGWS